MSADRFPAALALVLGFEGGFVDDPQDPGGATCLGVTLDTLSAWRGHRCAVADVRSLTREAVAPIYRAHYWNGVQADALQPGEDLILFDGAVNQGVGGMTRMLQVAVGVEPDGALGPATLKAISSRYPGDVIKAVQAARIAAYKRDAGFERFGAGWLRRVNSVAATAFTWGKADVLAKL